MTLRQARCEFSRALALLILKGFEMGYEIAIDEVTEHITKKDPTSDHMRGSLHHEGLAGDLILYKDGKYLTETSDYAPLGLWWETYGEEKGIPLKWGGHFNDGNHFSLARGGRK